MFHPPTRDRYFLSFKAQVEKEVRRGFDIVDDDARVVQASYVLHAGPPSSSRGLLTTLISETEPALRFRHRTRQIIQTPDNFPSTASALYNLTSAARKGWRQYQYGPDCPN